MADDAALSIKELYGRAEKRRLELESSPLSSSSVEYQSAVEGILGMYSKCKRAIDSLSLFSPNETLDDLATSDLPYLLFDYHIATLTDRTATDSPPARLALLRRVRHSFEQFLALADSYGLLDPSYARMWTRYAEAPRQFSTTDLPGTDAAARRTAKIAGFRAEKELKQKLAALRSNPRYLSDDGGGDDEIVRDVHLAAVACSVHLAFQALDAMNREEEVLSLAESGPEGRPAVSSDERQRLRNDDDDNRNNRPRDGYSDRLDPPLKVSSFLAGGGPVLDHEGKPLKPFTLVSSRHETTRSVFRPGHNLPTMSIDEYLAEERRRGGIIDGGGEASLQSSAEPDEDDHEKADAETMKQRHWDDFTEANPKGWGNTLNKG